MHLPHLSQARAPLTREVSVVNEHGERSSTAIPAERDLTVYVDKRELVTLMTLGAHPELLVLGFLRNQRLVASVGEIESITVDWDVNSAAVKTRSGIDNIEARTAKKVVTTGCGQGSVFGSLMDEIDSIQLPASTLTQAQLYGITNAIRLQETTYKSAGSVHGCALFRGEEMVMFVEDVGRHNAIDTIAGWMWMNGINMAPTLATACAALPPAGEGAPAMQVRGALAPKGGLSALDASSAKTAALGDPYVFYTTGRLTSEMVIKSAQMGIAIVVSRSGITQMGHDLATKLGLCTIGRAMNKRFLCYTAAERLQLDPSLAGPKTER
jgi:FdhD protein